MMTASKLIIVLAFIYLIVMSTLAIASWSLLLSLWAIAGFFCILYFGGALGVYATKREATK